MPICITEQNVCDEVDSRADDILNEVDLVDTHVLDSRSVNTTEHNDVNDHLNSVNDNVSLVGNQVSADTDLIRGDISTLSGNLSGVSSQITSFRSDMDGSWIDQNNFNIAVSALISADTSAVSTVVNARADTIDANLATANNHLNAISGNGGFTLHSVQDTVINAVNGIAATLTGIVAQLTLLIARPAPVRRAGASYAVVAETDWSQTLHWLQPADFYLVTISAVPSSSGEEMSTPSRYPRIGWCAVHGPNGALDSIQQMDFANRVVTSATVDPAGLELYCKPGTMGHVQACTNS